MLLDICQRSKLIAKQSTQAGLQKEVNHQRKNVYFGIGFCTTKAMSEGLPIDVLSMLSIAKATTDMTGGKIVVLLADTHAMTNSFAEPLKVKEMAGRYKKMIKNLTKESDVEVMTASEYRDLPEFKAIASSVNQAVAEKGLDVHPYVIEQSSDTAYMSKVHGVGYKIGWVTDDKEAKGFDERYFDKVYDTISNDGMRYLYSRSGLSNDPKRPRVSPYTAAPGEGRVLLSSHRSDAYNALDAYEGNKKLLDHAEALVHDFAVNFNRLLTGENTRGRVMEVFDLANKEPPTTLIRQLPPQIKQAQEKMVLEIAQ